MLVAAILLLTGLSSQGRVIYVNGSSNTDPVPDGLSWATAFGTVQEGISLAAAGDEVWVAAATYSENINLKAGVALYGGFAGNESALNQRNWTNDLSVLDGRQTNSVVVVQSGATNTTRIDGFIIQNGHARNGGGILCSNTSPTIANNRVALNSSSGLGGGIFCHRSASVITGNQILNNSATFGQGIYVVDSEVVISGNLISGNRLTQGGFGGGIYCGKSSRHPLTPLVVITNNVISDNAAFSGGGIECDYGTKTFIADNLIINNSAAAYGAGMEIYTSSVTAVRNRFEGNNTAGAGGAVSIWSSAITTITDNAMRNNTAQAGGGIYIIPPSSLFIANNTIVSNVATNGGAIANYSTNSAIANNILAFNSSGISQQSASLRNNCVFGNHGLDYQDIPDQTGSDGNISVDPLLVSSNDFHLAAGSPCINAGDDTVVLAGSTDLDGQARKAGAHVDIGADEFGSVAPFSLSLTTGSTANEHLLRLVGEPGQTYVVERGSEFTDWLAVSTNSAPTGVMELPVAAPGGPGQVYYRAVTPAP